MSTTMSTSTGSRLRVPLLASIVLNLALAGWIATHRAQQDFSALASKDPGEAASAWTRKGPAGWIARGGIAGVAPHIWPQIESTNYVNYIQNLRQVGCPEPTIADIIVADVGQLFGDARSNARAAARQRGDSQAVADRQLRALDQQEEQVLVELLGDSWRRSRQATDDGGVSGLDWLPVELAGQVRAIEQQGDDEAETIRARAGRALTASDREALQQIERRRDSELARLLGPDGVVEYRFRSSGAAEALAMLPGVSFTDEAEMRRVFVLESEVERQRDELAGDGDRADELRQIDERATASLKALLGEDRYARLLRARDFRFQQLNDLAIRFGLDSAVAERVYALHQESGVPASGESGQEDVERIAAWTGQLTGESRQQALSLLGEQAFAAYREVARDW